MSRRELRRRGAVAVAGVAVGLAELGERDVWRLLVRQVMRLLRQDLRRELRRQLVRRAGRPLPLRRRVEVGRGQLHAGLRHHRRLPLGRRRLGERGSGREVRLRRA